MSHVCNGFKSISVFTRDDGDCWECWRAAMRPSPLVNLTAEEEVAACDFLGDEIPGPVRQSLGLDNVRRWAKCLNPSKPLGTNIVCPCQGCGIGCRGYTVDGKKGISVQFRHGIGDAVNFAHMIPLYTRRGYTISIHPGHADHAPVFRAAGTEIIAAGRSHEWGHAPMPDVIPSWPRPWERNKNGWNLSRYPLPPIGDPAELWKEYIAERIDFTSQVTDADRQLVDGFIDGAKPLTDLPIIALHFRGFDWADGQGKRRNYPDAMALDLMQRLLAATEGTLVVLDRDVAHVRLDSPRVRYLSHFGPGVLYEVLRRADVFAGIDSGPLNFIRLTGTPAVGIWNCHYPADYVLPRENTVHVVPAEYCGRDRYARIHWNTILAPTSGQPSPEFLAKVIGRVLGRKQYLDCPARDVQLRSFVDRTDSSFRNDFDHCVDRHESFDLALRHLASIENPVVVETGTIRHEEDWAGAGFSTYLLAAFIEQHGGELHSIDLMPDRVTFAREWTRQFHRTTIHERHSHDFLAAWGGRSIALFYSDSADTTEEGYQECCIEEVKRALPLLSPNARIIIDDTPPDPKGGWQGKGSLAVPWLLANGWMLQYSGWQVVLSRRPE